MSDALGRVKSETNYKAKGGAWLQLQWGRLGAGNLKICVHLRQRGRSAGCPTPPSRIPACSFPAPGSSPQLALALAWGVVLASQIDLRQLVSVLLRPATQVSQAPASPFHNSRGRYLKAF